MIYNLNELYEELINPQKILFDLSKKYIEKELNIESDEFSDDMISSIDESFSLNRESIECFIPKSIYSSFYDFEESYKKYIDLLMLEINKASNTFSDYEFGLPPEVTDIIHNNIVKRLKK